MKKLGLWFLILFTSLYFHHSAYADWHVAAMQCDGDNNRLLVRFGMNGGFYAEIPPSLQSSWTSVSTEEVPGSSSCRFKNGKNIYISITTTPEMDTLGGGDVNGYFSLKIDGKRVYDNEQFYQGQMISIYLSGQCH